MAITKRAPVIVNPLLRHPEDLRLTLSGNDWLFRLDPEDRGLDERWYVQPNSMLELINVPGTWQGQGYGGSEKEVQKETGSSFRAFKTSYEGTGWYRKRFTVPDGFRGKRLWLNFGGVAPTCEVWLNGIKLGENHEPLVPFGFEVTDCLREGENTLTCRVSEEDRTMCLTFWHEGKWSGIYRDVELVATGQNYIDFFSAVPDVDRSKLAIRCRVGCPDRTAAVKILLTAPDGAGAIRAEAVLKEGYAEFDLDVPDLALWSPEQPALYRLDALLCEGDAIMDGQCHRIGFVKFDCGDKQFRINGQPYYMRGCGDFAHVAETVCPSTDRELWRRHLQVLRDYGYLYVRCQSYIPVPEYFDVADEVGVLVQSEAGVLGPICGFSPDHTYNQWPKPTPDYREKYREQWNHLVQRDANHVSANMYCMSNELGGPDSIKYHVLAERCYRETKAIKPTALVIWTDGAHADRDGMPGDFINDEATESLVCDKPVIQHEFRWWSSYPDIRLIPKYRDLPMRPMAEERAMEAATARGISHVLVQAAENSQALHFLEAKGKMEALRRDFPHLAGVCHFNAADNAASKQGIVNIFYEKKYADAALWQRTNGDTVVLCSLNFDDRCHEAGEKVHVDLFVSDFSHPAFRAPQLKWELCVAGECAAGGELCYEHMPFMTCPAGEIEFNVPEVAAPKSAVLKARLEENGRWVVNEWKLWFFPRRRPLPEGISFEPGEGVKTLITEKFDERLLPFVDGGGNVIVKVGEGFTRPFGEHLGLKDGRYFFTKPASFPPYEEQQHGTIIRDHPMLGDFPHESYADMQFYNLIGESPAIDLEPL